MIYQGNVEYLGDIEGANLQFYYQYFNYFGSNINENMAMFYSAIDYVSEIRLYAPQAETAIAPASGESWPETMTFNGYPSKGWMAECTTSTSSIYECMVPNYHKGVGMAEYQTSSKIFIYYVTADMQTSPMEYDIDRWLWENLPWAWACNTDYDFCPSAEPPAPSVDAMIEVLTALGVSSDK